MSNSLHVWHDGSTSMVAYSPEDAAKAWNEWAEENYALDEYEWELIPDDTELEIFWDEGEEPDELPEGATVRADPGQERVYVKATAAAWIKHNGRGWLCSEDW